MRNTPVREPSLRKDCLGGCASGGIFKLRTLVEYWNGWMSRSLHRLPLLQPSWDQLLHLFTATLRLEGQKLHLYTSGPASTDQKMHYCTPVPVSADQKMHLCTARKQRIPNYCSFEPDLPRKKRAIMQFLVRRSRRGGAIVQFLALRSRCEGAIVQFLARRRCGAGCAGTHAPGCAPFQFLV